jgi:uncharacterized protein (TIGR02246 family)
MPANDRLEISDHEQIRALLARYNVAIDHGDADGWAACFTPDGVFESTGVEPRPVRVEGTDALREFAAAQHAVNQGRGRHWTNNELITIDGDEATLDCYLVAFTTSRRIASTGEYHDRLRRHDGQWRFALRHVDVDARPTP